MNFRPVRLSLRGVVRSILPNVGRNQIQKMYLGVQCFEYVRLEYFRLEYSRLEYSRLEYSCLEYSCLEYSRHHIPHFREPRQFRIHIVR